MKIERNKILIFATSLGYVAYNFITHSSLTLKVMALSIAFFAGSNLFEKKQRSTKKYGEPADTTLITIKKSPPIKLKVTETVENQLKKNEKRQKSEQKKKKKLVIEQLKKRFHIIKKKERRVANNFKILSIQKHLLNARRILNKTSGKLSLLNKIKKNEEERKNRYPYFPTPH